MRRGFPEFAKQPPGRRSDRRRYATAVAAPPPPLTKGEFFHPFRRERSCNAWGLLLCLMLLSTGCAVGPDYKRPEYPVPPSHRSDTALPATASDTSRADSSRHEMVRSVSR